MALEKKSVLIIYEFFYPAYKAGGIVRSLYNIVHKLSSDYTFYVVTGGFDLGENTPMQGVEMNTWSSVTIGKKEVKIWYDEKKSSSPNSWKKIIQDVKPDVVYINGFMHLQFLLYPLIALRSFKNIKTVIAPRGMLQQGAIDIKPLKKFIYLQFIKVAKLTRNVYWHFTSNAEAIEANQLGWGITNATIIPNLFAEPVDNAKSIHKNSGSIKLVYASIITPKKNLAYLIQSLQHCIQKIELSIYGVIKENDYWEDCKKSISQLPENIRVSYMGDFQPHEMERIVTEAHAMVLLSKAENFSHAIVESLSVGRPIVSSNFTSWNALEVAEAGWNVSIDNELETAASIDRIALLDNTSFEKYYNGALLLARQHYNAEDYSLKYKLLFS